MYFIAKEDWRIKPSVILNEFRADERNWERYKAWPQKVEADHKILERHQMQLTTQRQLSIGVSQSTEEPCAGL